jgi:hypothetical protein
MNIIRSLLEFSITIAVITAWFAIGFLFLPYPTFCIMTVILVMTIAIAKEAAIPVERDIMILLCIAAGLFTAVLPMASYIIAGICGLYVVVKSIAIAWKHKLLTTDQVSSLIAISFVVAFLSGTVLMSLAAMVILFVLLASVLVLCGTVMDMRFQIHA